MSEPWPTVFIVDDDASVRKSLIRLLKAAGYYTESFASANEFLDRWKENPVHGCIVLDIRMPGLDGMQLQEKLYHSTNGIPIIFITGHGDIPSSVKAIKAGAVDFLPKPFQDEVLLQAIREAIQRDAANRSERTGREVVARRYETLTPREREVMELVVQGLMNKQIAFALGTSEKTIKIHRARGMEKMQVRSVADLVRAVQKLDMLPEARTDRLK
jgi:FixJ family two-component response regulator